MSGKSLPWLPWFHRDFLAATQGWTLLERGAYFMLLNAQWEMGALPNDRRRLAGIIGAELEELESIWGIVGPKFDATPIGLVNHRLEQHRAKQTERSAKARQSARLRWVKTEDQDASADSAVDANASKTHPKSKTNGSASGHALHMLPDAEPEPRTEDAPLANARGAPVAAAALDEIATSAPQSRGTFEGFWAFYPKKRKRKDAHRVWCSKRLDNFGAALIEDVKRRMSEDARWINGYIPDPPTYLRGELWNDAMEPVKVNGRQHSNSERAAKEHAQILDLAEIMRIEQGSDDWQNFSRRVLEANERRLQSLAAHSNVAR